MNNNKAFSLIELSMVLIIIGLLVAGITGGQSLIESARKRKLIEEIHSYKQAVYSFYLLYDRLPGDKNGSGTIGWNSNQRYNKNSFPFPYDGTDEKNNHFIPNTLNAPFVDLYLAKIISFESKGNFNFAPHNAGSLTSDFLPFSTIIPHMYFHFQNNDLNGQDTLPETHCMYKNKGQHLVFRSNNYGKIKKARDNPILQGVDIKLDDGIYNTGEIRAGCYGPKEHGNNSYEESTNNNKWQKWAGCTILNYNMDVIRR